MTLTVKILTEEAELRELVNLEASLFGCDAWTEAQLRSEVENFYTKVYLLLDEIGQIMGYTIIRMVLDEGELLRLGIRQDWQGIGLGRQLLFYTLDELRKLGIKEVFLEVAEDNLRALSLYKKLGFKVVGKRAQYFSPRRSAYIMSKNLEEENHVTSWDQWVW